MTDDAELLDLLRCPETHGRLLPVTRKWIDRLNSRIEAEELRDGSGELVSEPIEDGLVTDDERYLYPIRDGVPNLFMSDRIILKEP